MWSRVKNEKEREREREIKMAAMLPALGDGRMAGFQVLCQEITSRHSSVNAPFTCPGLSGFQFPAFQRALMTAEGSGTLLTGSRLISGWCGLGCAPTQFTFWNPNPQGPPNVTALETEPVKKSFKTPRRKCWQRTLWHSLGDIFLAMLPWARATKEKLITTGCIKLKTFLHFE